MAEANAAAIAIAQPVSSRSRVVLASLLDEYLDDHHGHGRRARSGARGEPPAGVEPATY